MPSFSAKEDPGSTTSAQRAVSVRKRSCTARNSSRRTHSSALATLGSESTGFSPMMYMPRTGLPSFTISVTMSPFSSERDSAGTPHAAAYSARVPGSVTGR